ncbi:MAG: DUF429 domain-containing protein [Candidatus Acetothermia bacterium]|jgi:predicted RNase H-like nuclease|nr:DUF429 domain-containing protein [Candidatus Acetothermia bacterium]
MRFVGVDLAWSYRNPSAAVALAWQEGIASPLAWEPALESDDQLLAFIGRVAEDGPALVAVDAPLVVPNETGARPCDLAVSRAYRRQQAGAHPANRRRLGPRVRGEELVARLGGLGFVHSPVVRPQAPVRQVVEVYPHPATVELFSLPRTLKYKARRDRPYPLRWRELERYRTLLRSLAGREPPMEAGLFLAELDPVGRRGRSLKRCEDLLDALFCAYLALHIWYWGEAGYRRFGDLATGYILVPVRPELTDRGTPAGLG